jgi:hypothetical protein
MRLHKIDKVTYLGRSRTAPRTNIRELAKPLETATVLGLSEMPTHCHLTTDTCRTSSAVSLGPVSAAGPTRSSPISLPI